MALCRPILLVPTLMALLAFPGAYLRAGKLTKQAMARKMEKSLLIENRSNGPYRFALLPPGPEAAKHPGTLEVWALNDKGELVSKGELKDSKDVDLGRGEALLLAPHPARPLASRVGVSARPDFNRTLRIKDRTSGIVVLRIQRKGEGDKVPTVAFENPGANRAGALRLEEDNGLPVVAIKGSSISGP